MTPRQQRFVDEYLIDLNATAAARRAGYSAKTAEWQGPQLLGKPHVAAAVAEAMESRSRRTGITADRVLQELAAIAFADPRRLFDPDGAPLPLSDLDDDIARAVATVEHGPAGGVGGGPAAARMRLHDKLKALEMLGRHLGLFSERLRLTGELTATHRVIKVPLKELAPDSHEAAVQRAGSVVVPLKTGQGVAVT
jgi:phage terminase small subunit